jgi:hypothetical protein
MGYHCSCALEWVRGIGLLDAVDHPRRTEWVGISDHGPAYGRLGPAYGRLATVKLTKRHCRVRCTARCERLIQVGCTGRRQSLVAVSRRGLRATTVFWPPLSSGRRCLLAAVSRCCVRAAVSSRFKLVVRAAVSHGTGRHQSWAAASHGQPSVAGRRQWPIQVGCTGHRQSRAAVSHGTKHITIKTVAKALLNDTIVYMMKAVIYGFIVIQEISRRNPKEHSF